MIESARSAAEAGTLAPGGAEAALAAAGAAADPRSGTGAAPRVSIVAAAYNAGRFLRRGALRDLFEQTYPHWELILVDDGSTDDTAALCDAFAVRDPRVRVVHRPNGGPGSARNAGLDLATGDYVWFFDVDDRVDPGLLEYCVGEMERRGADLLVFGFEALTEATGSSEEVRFPEREIRSNGELRSRYLDDLLLVRYGNGFVWNKCFRRSFVERHGLRFGDQRIQEDEAFLLELYPHLERALLSPRVFYRYRIHASGNAQSRFLARRFDDCCAVYDRFRRLQALWDLADPRFEEYLCRRFWGNVDACLRFNLFAASCPWRRAERRHELCRILDDRRTQRALACVRRHGLLGIEERMFLALYGLRSVRLLGAAVFVTNLLRRLKHALG